MDAAKKAKLEQLAVMVLLLVFVGSLANGPLGRQLFRSQSGGRIKTAVSGQLKAIKPLEESVKEHWNNMMTEVDKVTRGDKPSQSKKAPRYAAANLRNPMQSWMPKPPEPKAAIKQTGGDLSSKAVKPPTPPTLTVQGLFWGNVEPQAIVNGRLCRVGDRVDGAVITAIDREGITAEFEGIKLNKEVTKAGGRVRGSSVSQRGR